MTGPHVLVARMDSMGDVLLAGPAVRAVAAGAARVTLLCGPRGRAAAELLPGVDEVVCFSAAWIDPEPGPVARRDVLDLVARVEALRVEEAAILTSFHQSALPLALLLRMAGVGRIAAISEDYPGSLLDVRHRVPDHLHEVERGLSVVKTLGYSLPAGDDGRLAVRAAAGPPPAALAGPVATEPYVVVHPGASVPARAWSPAKNRDLVASLSAAGRVVVTGGPDEVGLTAFVAGGRRNVVDLGGRLDLPQLAAVLAGAVAVVTGNTGPAHLAAAVGTPVVSLFAPTVAPAAWRPWGVRHVLLGGLDIGCAGCRARVCPVPNHPCIDRITVPEVVRAIDKVVAHPAAAGRQGVVV
ncbi:MAG: glycosyltransferase family 9 protein [Acidimicrobiia bacterium]